MFTDHIVLGAGHPIPALAEPFPALDRLVALVRRYYPGIPEEATSDYDLFVEDALRLDYALASTPHDRLWVRQLNSGRFGSRDNEDVMNVATGERRKLGEFIGSSIWGPVPTTDTAPSSEALVNRQGYSRLEAFARNAGRYIALASALDDDEGATDYSDLLRKVRAADAAHGGAAVKIVGRDKFAPISFVHATQAMGDTQLRKAIEAGLGEEGQWITYNLGMTEDAYLVQGAVGMHHEYRLFVANHEVTVGAGCIVDFTPLNSIGLDFDHRTQDVRGKSPVEQNPEVVARLVEFGRKVAREIQDEQPELRSYVLDVALDDHGDPLVVELNGLLNAGLYALNIQHLVSTLFVQEALPVITPQVPSGRC